MPQSGKASRPERPLRRTAPWGTQAGKLDGTSCRPEECLAHPKAGWAPGSLGWESRPKQRLFAPPGARAGASGVASNPLTGAKGPPRTGAKDSYLVDSASSHMLVSKIKPCMSKYKQLYGETANGSLNQLSFI